MNTNEYFEVINGQGTYSYIASVLKDGRAIMIGWTDQEYTHYDIMFKLGVVGEGGYQRGIKNSDLIVAIMSIGAFGFKTDDKKHPTYVAEKLFNSRCDSSVEKVTELMNGIIEELNK